MLKIRRKPKGIEGLPYVEVVCDGCGKKITKNYSVVNEKYYHDFDCYRRRRRW